MAYPEDLLNLARELVQLHPAEAHQPSLRRAISTGYYALFHLLISDAVATCTDQRFRALLARVFDHGPMKQACDKAMSEVGEFFKQRPQEGPDRTLRYHLFNVAETFSQAQQDRFEADYNLLREWQPMHVLLSLECIADAFQSWTLIRDEPLARDFLASMLPSKERKQGEKPRARARPTLTDNPEP
ncbi:MAG: hypothetical protein U0Q16_37315 [Bryobacteraceae bacterium]